MLRPIKSKADTNCSSFARGYDGKRSPAVINQIAKLGERYPLRSVRHPVVEIGTSRNTTCWRTDFVCTINLNLRKKRDMYLWESSRGSVDGRINCHTCYFREIHVVLRQKFAIYNRIKIIITNNNYNIIITSIIITIYHKLFIIIIIIWMIRDICQINFITYPKKLK